MTTSSCDYNSFTNIIITYIESVTSYQYTDNNTKPQNYMFISAIAGLLLMLKWFN